MCNNVSNYKFLKDSFEGWDKREMNEPIKSIAEVGGIGNGGGGVAHIW